MILRSDQTPFPDWCELRAFEIVRLAAGERRRFDEEAPREKLFVGAGEGLLRQAGTGRRLTAGDVVDLRGGCTVTASGTALGAPMTLVWAAGRWGGETGGSGVFTLDNAAVPRNAGDPVDYPRTTDFDNHYHDCDEYWILFEGRGRVVTGGRAYDVGPGDCVATPAGTHHDFPEVYETVHGVYLETTLVGRKRLGHLWRNVECRVRKVE